MKSEEMQKQIYELNTEREESIAKFKERSTELNAKLEEALAEEAADEEDS